MYDSRVKRLNIYLWYDWVILQITPRRNPDDDDPRAAAPPRGLRLPPPSPGGRVRRPPASLGAVDGGAAAFAPPRLRGGRGPVPRPARPVHRG